MLLKKQNEVLNVLEQLELRLKKLSILSNDVKNGESISEKQSVILTSCNTVGEKCKIESKSKVNVGIENLINVKYFLFLLKFHVYMSINNSYIYLFIGRHSYFC